MILAPISSSTAQRRQANRKKISNQQDSATENTQDPSDRESFSDILEREAAVTAPHGPTEPAATHAITPVDKKVLARLISQCETQGHDLLKNPSLAQYARYKSSLEVLMQKIIPQTFKLKRSYSRAEGSHEQQKEYQVIEIVSKELHSLITLIKETHKDRIAMAAHIDRINGLIIDLLG